MATRIPLPGNWSNALFEGVQERNRNQQNMMQRLMQAKLAEQQLAQQHAHHYENLGAKQQHYEQLAKQFAAQQARYEAQEARKQKEFEFKQLNQPLNSDLKRAQIEKEMALADKARRYQAIPKETPEEKAIREIETSRAKEQSKIDQRYRAKNLESLEAGQDVLSELQQAKELLGTPPNEQTGEPGNKQYDYATSALGPLDVKLPAIRKGTRQFRGEFQRLAGRMKANIARLEKGATSDKERAMIDKAEISEEDSWTTASGKLLAQEKYLKKLIQRKTKIEDLMEMGYPRAKAISIASKETSFTDKDNSEKKIKIRNKITGEEKEVTQDEYNILSQGAQ